MWAEQTVITRIQATVSASSSAPEDRPSLGTASQGSCTIRSRISVSIAVIVIVEIDRLVFNWASQNQTSKHNSYSEKSRQTKTNTCNLPQAPENLLCNRLFMLRVFKYYRYSKDELTKLFDSLTMSLFLYGIEIWGEAFRNKYLDRIRDKFLKRAFQFG